MACIFNPFTDELDYYSQELIDDGTTPPEYKNDGYASVVETEGEGRIYFFVGGNRYYVTGIPDNPVLESGSPMGLLLSLTYA